MDRVPETVAARFRRQEFLRGFPLEQGERQNREGDPGHGRGPARGPGLCRGQPWLLSGLKDGQGLYTYVNGDVYDGGWRLNVREG